MTQTIRFFFDDLGAAAEALLLVLDDARTTKLTYQFGSLSVSQIYQSGLILTGEVAEVSVKLEKLSGVLRHDG